MVAKKGQVKVGKLKVNRETVKNLTTAEKKQVKGGIAIRPKTLAPTGTAGCTAPGACTQ